MKQSRSVFFHILVFILAQIAWFSLLGLWIYWYVSNYIIFRRVGDKLSPQIFSDTTNIFALVGGLVLLVVISVGMSLIFIYLNRQLHLAKLYDDFIASVTHEFKSPLSSMQLYLETMRKRKVQKEKQVEFIDLMLRDIDRLNHLINSILYLSGIEQKKMQHKYPHDFNIYDADSILREIIKEAARQLNIPLDAIRVNGAVNCQCVIDRHWFGIVFDNLFDNAVKYSEGPAEIDIHLSCTGKNVVIEIKDKGIGISLKDQKKVFHKFQRINHPTIPNVKGTGLGLYWVKEIVRYHGGKIYLFSKGYKQGTTFRIELPVYRASKKKYLRNLLKRSKNKLDVANE